MSLLQDLTKILKEANAGYNFDDNGQLIEDQQNDYVNPEVNEDNVEYINARKDEIKSVLKSPTNLDYTNSVNKYLRLLMPRYKRRVEVEDLNRNFWVISQAIAKISEYLTKGLNTRKEIVILPNSKDYGYFKYDNFDNYGENMNITEITSWTEAYCKSWEDLIFDRLSYLKETYPNNDLLIIPVIRQDNYYHNYYKKEIYLGVYSYNKEKEEDKFYWFYNNNTNEIEPIIMEATPTLNKYVYHLAEDQLTLKLYWAFGDAAKQQVMQDHTLAYITALRAIPKFVPDSNNITIDIEDALGKALSLSDDLYNCSYNIIFSDDKYKWTKVEHTPIHSGEEEKGEITQGDIRGYYLGELSSQREVYSDISDYDLSFEKTYIRPIVPSYYQIYWMLSHPDTLSDIRSKKTPAGTENPYLSTIGNRFLDSAYDTTKDPSTLRFYNLLGTVSDDAREQYNHEKFMKYTKDGKDENDHYQNYKSASSNKNIMTQHGEDAAIIDLQTEELKRKYTDKLKVHFFTHPLSLQKIYNGKKADIEDKLNTILTAHYVNNQPELQKLENIRGKDGGYLVYEYDGYLTKTSCNTIKPSGNTSLGRTFVDATNVDILRTSPRRDTNVEGQSTKTFFKDAWQTKDLAPFQIIAVDNGDVPRAQHSDTVDPSGSGQVPRFTHALEEFVYGAIIQIPYSTSASLCYPINNYNLFENALKHSLAFWRPKFRIDRSKTTPEIQAEDYGRRHKIYTTITYYKHKDKDNILMLKIVNVGITFGPQIKVKINDSDAVIPLTNIPTEYQKGYYLLNDSLENNWITFDKTKSLSDYQNKDGKSKYLSPLAPLYCCGWPIRSATDTAVAWSNGLDGNTDRARSQDLVNNAKVILKDKILDYLTSGQTAFQSFEYSPLYTKPINISTKGTDGTVLPINTNSNSLTFNCPEALKNALDNTDITNIDCFTKSDSTLNEGIEYPEVNGQCKFYGFSTLVHTMYVKIDLNDDGKSEHFVSILKRVNYDNNLITDGSRLLWKKETNGEIKNDTNIPYNKQNDIEQYIKEYFDNKGSKGDFANNAKELLFDFSRYPSNGQTPQKDLDPEPQNIFAHENGDIMADTATVNPSYDDDMTLNISLPEQTAYGNYTLTDDTITGTGIAQQDTKYYILLALKCADDESTETIPSVQYTINGNVLTPESDVGNVKTFKVEIQMGTDTITISAEHSGYCTENKTLTVTVQPEPVPSENTSSEENPE